MRICLFAATLVLVLTGCSEAKDVDVQLDADYSRALTSGAVSYKAQTGTDSGPTVNELRIFRTNTRQYGMKGFGKGVELNFWRRCSMVIELDLFSYSFP